MIDCKVDSVTESSGSLLAKSVVLINQPEDHSSSNEAFLHFN